jgi:hypothetical protein
MKKIIILVPGDMPKRLLTETPILENLLHHKEISLSIVSSSLANDGAFFKKHNIKWFNIYSPKCEYSAFLFFLLRISYYIQVRLFKFFRITFHAVCFRFNSIQGFKSHLLKIKLPSKNRKRELLAGNCVDKNMGWPFPKSNVLYRYITKIFYNKWIMPNPDIFTFYKQVKPDIVVFLFSQNELLHPWYIAAKRFDIATISVTGSWDRLTTKGPLFPDFDKYIVHSNKMRSEMVLYNDISLNKIVNVGWPQMDRFFSKKIDRLTFLKKYNIPSNSKIILFAANGARHGSHEPTVLEHIRNQINNYNYPIFLIIRPHPKDALWERRLSSVKTIKNEILMAADFGNIEVLGELLQFSDLLISTQGSISLDAIAMNLPVVNLAFDTIHKGDSESVSRLYEMDHYADIAKSGAVLMANSFDDLDTKINQCLSSPNYNKEAVNLLRNSDIEPFDGRSSERLVAEIIST